MKKKISREEQAVRILRSWWGYEEEGFTWTQLHKKTHLPRSSLSDRLVTLMEEDYLKREARVVDPGTPKRRIDDFYFLKRPQLGTAYEMVEKTAVFHPKDPPKKLNPEEDEWSEDEEKEEEDDKSAITIPQSVNCGVLRSSGKTILEIEQTPKGKVRKKYQKMGFRRVTQVKIVPGQTVEELRPPSSSLEEYTEECRKADSESWLRSMGEEGKIKDWPKDFRRALRESEKS